MRYFSMFSGIGGFEYGIEKATSVERGRWSNTQEGTDLPDATSGDGNGWWESPTCIGFSEIDKYAIQQCAT